MMRHRAAALRPIPLHLAPAAYRWGVAGTGDFGYPSRRESTQARTKGRTTSGAICFVRAFSCPEAGGCAGGGGKGGRDVAQVNGRARPDADGLALEELLALDGFDAARVACELNGEIVPRDKYACTVLRAGDVLEVVRFVGGG